METNPLRYIVYGVGAIGGVVAAALQKGGQKVAGIARGERLAALSDHGLTLRSPSGTTQVDFPCAGSVPELGLGAQDVVLLAMKGQDTAGALLDLRTAGLEDQPVFCVQNGVANESQALRLFPNVHGVNVMLPAEYLTARETIAWASPNWGCFDIGRFPSGKDAHDDMLAKVLTAGGIASQAVPDVMDYKYGKLLMNLSNIVEAALGRGVEDGGLRQILREEGERVLRHVGIAWRDVGASDPRRASMKQGEVDG
ncbi:MAG: 2-dehydropantoate 2-reductase N-terminal domain-containing protein, partial [Planctomycetota bacterium]